MRKSGILIAILLLGALLPCSNASATDDGMYYLLVKDAGWDGTYASRTIAPIVAPVGASHQYDYDYTYGDDASITYTLPWAFSFYGTPYSKITVDTNGNVWFDSRITGTNPTLPGSAHSLNLASNGRGPFIAAWNNDLSSYYYGGVFIQHKTNPERVVIEWQTETYTNEGNSLPNYFEVVLYQNGKIRNDYYALNSTAAKDMGSGISNNNGKYISITADAAFGNAYGLTGKSLQFDSQELVSVAFAGNGSGNVISNPAGLNCTINCTNAFTPGISLTLTATASSGSAFTGWSGGLCAGTGPCSLTLENEMTTTATFTQLPTANFSTTLSTASAPVSATFTNSSVNATSWLWNFGDNTTSTLQNPTHIYKNPGTYTVRLTATNVAGTATTTQNIILTACASQPVKIGATYYATLQAAYNAAVDGGTIQILANDFTENLTSGQGKFVTLDGGYLCGFATNPDKTIIHGAPRLSVGTVKLVNFHIAANIVYTITATAGNNGTISPSSATVNSDANQTFTITPTTGYRVADVIVDGVSQGAVTSYTFSNIVAAHTISVNFIESVAPTGTIVINSGAALTNSVNAILALTATDASGVTQMQFSHDGVNYYPLEPFSTTRTVTLLGDGLKTVYVRFKDAAGNVSTAISDSITLDTVLPTGTIAINGGAALTNSVNATLTLTAADASTVTQMQFSKDGVTYFPFESFTTTRSVTLLSGDGVKNMYVRYKDVAGNVSTAISDSITLDATLPTGTISFVTSNPTTSATGTLALTASDANGVTQMQFSKNGSGYYALEPFSTSRTVTLDPGLNTIMVRFMDTAGNLSAPASTTITRN